MECRAIDEQERKTGDSDGRRRLIFETALLQKRRHEGKPRRVWGEKCRMKEGRNWRGNVRSGRSGQRWHYGVKGSRVGRGRDAGKTAGWCGRWLRQGS